MNNIRKAKPADKESILALVKGIWGGDDYIPGVFDYWLKEPGFYVYEIKGEVAGLTKLTEFSPGELWLEGLRVGRKFRGMGIANILTEFLLSEIRARGFKSVMYATGFDNKASIHIGNRYGFKVKSRLTNYNYNSRKFPSIKDSVKFVRDYKKVLDLINRSGLLTGTEGTLPEGWSFHLVTPDYIKYLCKNDYILSLTGFDLDEGLLIYKDKMPWENINILFMLGTEQARLHLIRHVSTIAYNYGKFQLSQTVPVYTRINYLFNLAGLELDWKFGVRLLKLED